MTFKLKWKQEMYEKRKHYLASVKIASGCVNCGLWGPDEVLTFDHVRGEKLFAIGSRWDISLEKAKEEIQKCEVVCFNCHAIRTAKQLKEKSTGIPPFEEFPKIPRYSRDVICTEKIDGSNGVVWVDGDFDVWPGSKNRWLTTEEDNFGFAKWIVEHEKEFQDMGPGVYRGEWWGQGIQRGYGLKEKRFSLFNVTRWDEGMFERFKVGAWEKNSDKNKGSKPEFKPPPACCSTVPIIAVGIFSWDVVSLALSALEGSGSYAAPGFMKPEGVVVYHTAGNHLYKKTIERDEEPKGMQGSSYKDRRRIIEEAILRG